MGQIRGPSSTRCERKPQMFGRRLRCDPGHIARYGQGQLRRHACDVRLNRPVILLAVGSVEDLLSGIEAIHVWIVTVPGPIRDSRESFVLRKDCFQHLILGQHIFLPSIAGFSISVILKEILSIGALNLPPTSFCPVRTSDIVYPVSTLRRASGGDAIAPLPAIADNTNRQIPVTQVHLPIISSSLVDSAIATTNSTVCVQDRPLFLFLLL